MAWLQLHIHSNPEQSSEMEDALVNLGALSITYSDNADQPILEPALGETPLWRETAITALFDAEVDSENINKQLGKTFSDFVNIHHWEIVEDKDWEREWMQHYHPIHCGESLWICPSWIEPPEENAVNVLLDPGLAFGTGTHPTTLLCLQWLAKQKLNNVTVVDFGCGSGILGIAALMLGAKRVIAVDIDPQALLATRENARRNGIEESQLETYFPNNLPEVAADLVFANILAGPLVSLVPDITSICKPKALICMSGVLNEQGQTVIDAYSELCKLRSTTNKEQWLQIALEKI